ncbi:hypothetical protein K8I31_03890, partial [bacterium]|nr:hypothetical protein [bacterium]
FPAYALLYRRGDVQAGDAVIHQILSPDDLYAMKGNGGAEAQSLDEFRNNDVPPGQSAQGQVEGIDPLSYYVGRVERTFADNPEDSSEVNLASFIDRDQKIIQSQTGELMWNYGDGLATVDTPNAQGCTGFLASAGAVQLSNIKIDSQNDYGSIIAISLDGKPLESSEKILIQDMTAERPYGFKVSGDEEGTITDVGGFPFGVKKIKTNVSLSLSDCSQLKVIALDENGYATDKSVEYQGGNNGEPLSIKLAEDAVYHIIQRTCTQKVGYWKMQN